jgi:uncharacterized damage-inducible protein DinB
MEPTAYMPIITALERAPLIILPLIQEMPEAVRKRRPASGKWSVHEHACHLAAVQPIAFERLRLMLEKDRPILKPYLPEQEHAPDALLSVDLDRALKQFKEDRLRLVSKLRDLQPGDWDRTAEHPEYNRYSVFILFRHFVLHDMLHAYRIEELLLNRD